MLPKIFSAFRSAVLPAPVTARRETAPELPPRSMESLPARRITGRREFHGMLWFPVFAVKDDAKLVVSAKAGLPHCVRCETPLMLESEPREQWKCALCGDARPGSEADFFVADSVVRQELLAFFEANPEYRPAPDLSAPKSTHVAEAV
jgi:hypothetical protein